MDALAWCERVAAIGAGELLLTSMDRDGTRDGFDLELTRAVVGRVARCRWSRRAGWARSTTWSRARVEGAADAVLAASIFHLGEFTVAEAKAHLAALPVSRSDRSER